MAGHSKWANIKHRKARQDKKRGAAFTKAVKKISSAARRGGGDPEMNAELRLCIEKAKAVNLPQDTIKRAILKATGQLEGVSYSDFTYEGYGAGGVAVYLEGSTDNKNRTVGNIRHAFAKHGGNLGENGCVAWMFNSMGIIEMMDDGVDVDALMEIALENGAEDFEHEDGSITIKSAPDDFPALRDAVIAAGHDDLITDEITMRSDTSVEPELSDVKQVLKMLDALEDDDDVENVYHNLELSDEVAAALEDDE